LILGYLGIFLMQEGFNYFLLFYIACKYTGQVSLSSLRKLFKSIEQKFNRFLWNGKDVKAAKAKVAWNDVCFPKKENGLGLKGLVGWN
jgi:hypothetical protein